MTIARDRFEDQVRQLLPCLLGVARRMTRSDPDAEDLVAECLTCAWRGIGSLQCEAALRGWLFQILHNCFVSQCRRNGARVQLEFAGGEEEEDEGEERFSLFEQVHQPFLLWFSNPEKELLDKLLREDIERALDSLPEHHRIVVVLADLEEFSYGEIAEALSIPVGTVRSRLARARSALQKLLWHQAQAYGLRGGESAAAAGGVQ